MIEIPDHRDNFPTDEEKAENSKIKVCSRSKSPLLTLDLKLSQLNGRAANSGPSR